MFHVPRCCHRCACECCLTEEERINRDIDRELRQLRRKNLYERKLLLLGNTEAGKSTFLKQMKLIHGRGFKPDEKRRTIPFIYGQIVYVVKCIIRAMRKLKISFEKPKNEEYARLLSVSDDYEPVSSFAPGLVAAIKSVWQDEGVKACYNRRREYRLTDSAKYFMDDIDRISHQDFQPTDDDMLRVRIQTTGIVQENFKFAHVELKVVDVGGQKTERRKWIHCFDNVTSVIFLASLIEYDQMVADEPNEGSAITVMEETKALFRIILQTEYFQNASVILFLNKTDLFQEHLLVSPLSKAYPEYKGDDHDVKVAQQFILDMYLSLIPDVSRNSERNVYPHFTCATDSKNIRIVFESVKDTVLANNLYYWTPF
ncbi:unnamed protein product [Didymodactylos carnosus]|uniref:Guanine nucleotide-binding protein G(q) subunit alpha n=1 Tax=Didymodactylos carnosus TaxID=1234261 RepID=A0A815DT44_9BILA|nr:unnamed protein product [Didymodactylos carnosus]CAF1301707.1 unnamed protein product [Didymodactylos carnosus]CAF3568869.1 unnamed protein product [Didymodactylos carnosus]CAF4127173.1 unnamed protein product [Didymodactylos carnosus]